MLFVGKLEFIYFLCCISIPDAFCELFSSEIFPHSQNPSIQTVPTLHSLKPNHEDRLWHGVHAVAFGKHDKHPQTLFASVPETPEQIFKLFSNHNLHMASEKHTCQKDRKQGLWSFPEYQIWLV